MDTIQDTKGHVDGGGSVKEPRVRGAVGGESDGERVVLPADWTGRAEPDGADYEFVGVSVYGVGGVVGGGEGYIERYVSPTPSSSSSTPFHLMESHDDIQALVGT